MNTKRFSKMVHEGGYAAEVDVDLMFEDSEWSPFLSLQDAYKLDDVREALRQGDIKTATRLSRVYALTRIAV